MDSPANSPTLHSFLLLIFIPGFVLSDTTENLVLFRHCSNITSPNDLTLSTLFQEFLLQSSYTKFYETSVLVNDNDDTPISGRFQCRKDLSQAECRKCMNNFPQHLCGSKTPARIQLSGCYVHYQHEGVETARIQLLHRSCSKHKLKKSGFEEVKYEALAEVESGVVSTGKGFFETTYGFFDVMAQCEEKLGACDCGECVSRAVHLAEEECKYSVSGEAYLDSCFISYAYHGDEFGSYSYEDDKGSSPKLIAIIIGGIVALSLVLAFFYFTTSCGKRRDDW